MSIVINGLLVCGLAGAAGALLLAGFLGVGKRYRLPLTPTVAGGGDVLGVAVGALGAGKGLLAGLCAGRIGGYSGCVAMTGSGNLCILIAVAAAGAGMGGIALGGAGRLGYDIFVVMS